MTPTQLRAFATVVKLGSVKSAAVALHVTEAAVSLHVGQLRRELGDDLFHRTGSGLAFTPGGLRLASRAVELLGLQDRTVQAVRQAGGGRRLLRVAASSLFAEYAAPGLIELFTSRASDLLVELSIHNAAAFPTLLQNRAVDAALGPAVHDPAVETTTFLAYDVVTVGEPGHPVVRTTPSPSMLREQTWLLGPSATDAPGVVPGVLRRIGVPEERQQIFQSHAAAAEEAKRGHGVALALATAVAGALADGSLVQVRGQQVRARGEWSIATLAGERAPDTAAELRRFVTTPRAIQAMLKGPGVGVGRFRPSVHVTLWN